MSLNIKCAELLGLDTTYEFWGEAYNFRIRKDFSIRGQIIPTDIEAGTELIWTELNSILSNHKDYEDVTVSGLNIGSGRLTDISFDPGTDVTKKTYTISLTVFEEGDLGNLDIDDLSGDMGAALQHFDELQETFSFSNNPDGTWQYSREVSMVIEDGGLPEEINPPTAAKELAVVLFENFSNPIVNSAYPDYYDSGHRFSTERYDLINNKFSFTENFRFQGEDPYIWIYNHSIEEDSVGNVIVREEGSFQGSEEDQYLNAQSGFLNQGSVANIYSRCNQLFTAVYNSEFNQEKLIIDKPVRFSVVKNEFLGSVEYSAEFSNIETPCRWSYSNSIEADEDGCASVSESGDFEGYGSIEGDPSERYLQALACFESDASLSAIYNRCLSFYQDYGSHFNDDFTLGENPRQFSKTINKIEGFISYEAKFSNNPSFLEDCGWTYSHSIESDNNGCARVIEQGSFSGSGDIFGDPSEKYNKALECYYSDITTQEVFNRCNNLLSQYSSLFSSGGNLNEQALSRSETFDEANGVVSYSLEFSNNPNNLDSCIWEYSQNISKNENNCISISEVGQFIGKLDCFSSSQDKFDKAKQCYQDNASEQDILSRCSTALSQYHSDEISQFPLNTSPTLKNETFNEFLGTVNYSLEFSTDPSINDDCFWSYSQTISQDQDGCVRISESGEISGRSGCGGSEEDRYAAALNCYSTKASEVDIFSRCQSALSNYQNYFGDSPLIENPLGKTETFNKFSGTISYETSFTNNPQKTESYYWSYSLEFSKDQNGCFSVSEGGQIKGVSFCGSSREDRYAAALAFYNSNISESSSYSKCNTFLKEYYPNQNDLSPSFVNFSEGFDEFLATINYQFVFSNDASISGSCIHSYSHSISDEEGGCINLSEAGTIRSNKNCGISQEESYQNILDCYNEEASLEKIKLRIEDVYNTYDDYIYGNFSLTDEPINKNVTYDKSLKVIEYEVVFSNNPNSECSWEKSISYQEDERGIVNVSESGSLSGRGSNKEERYDNVKQCFEDLVKDQTYNRCLSLYTERNNSDCLLGSTVLQKSLSHNPFSAVINYSYSYSSDPQLGQDCRETHSESTSSQAGGVCVISTNGNINGLGKREFRYSNALNCFSEAEILNRLNGEDCDPLCSQQFNLISASWGDSEYRGSINYTYEKSNDPNNNGDMTKACNYSISPPTTVYHKIPSSRGLKIQGACREGNLNLGEMRFNSKITSKELKSWNFYLSEAIGCVSKPEGCYFPTSVSTNLSSESKEFNFETTFKFLP